MSKIINLSFSPAVIINYPFSYLHYFFYLGEPLHFISGRALRTSAFAPFLRYAPERLGGAPIPLAVY